MSITPENNSYTFYLGDDLVRVGDAKAATFKPELTLTRWGREANFKVGFDDSAVSDKSSCLDAGKVKWESPSFDMHYYWISPTSQFEGGGVEYEIIFKAKPASNIISLRLDAENLRFRYQRPFPERFSPTPKGWTVTDTAVTDEKGVQLGSRPENVSGSYSVYHTSKKNNQYKAGKAFHIYRPQAVDAGGGKTWCSLHIADGYMTITVPQAFLDAAKYPVVVDPTFGKTDVGGTNWYRSPDNIQVLLATNTAGAGTGTKISVYMVWGDVGNVPTKLNLYADDRTQHANGTTEERILVRPFDDWQDFNFTVGPTIANNTAYKIAFWCDTAGGNLKHDDTWPDEDIEVDSLAYDGWPSPYTVDSVVTDDFSIYVSFDLAGGVTVKPGSTVAATMTQMLNSKMLFDVATPRRVPRFTPRLVT